MILGKKSMNFDLSKEQQEIQKAVDEFAKGELGKAVALDFEKRRNCWNQSRKLWIRSDAILWGQPLKRLMPAYIL